MYCFHNFSHNKKKWRNKLDKLTNKQLKTLLQQKFNNSTDFKVKEFMSYQKIKTIVFFFDNIVDVKRIDKEIISRLMLAQTLPSNANIVNYTNEYCVTVGQSEILNNIDDAIEKLLNGFCLLYFDKLDKFLVFDVKNFQSRSIAEPPTNAVLKGPREGFNENIATNIMLLRKRLKNADFVVHQQAVGKYSQTQVAIIYISSIADDKIVKKIKQKIQSIDIDGIIDAFYIQKAIEERSYSLFQQVGATEKPDVVTAKLLEGRIGIIVDGSPIVLTVPYLLLEDLQSSNDYYFARAPRVTFLRFLRMFGILIAIYLPAIYVAVQVFHYKILPYKFLVTITNSTLGIPFTPLIEILFVILLFEGLTEASLRMPSYLGLALSIVGALILGDTAVNAGLVSSPAVMIVALTGVLLFTVPDQESQLSMLRLIFTIIGGILGIYGIICASVFLLAYLSNLDSYGTPFLAPYAPNIQGDKKDAFRRYDLRELKYRPKSIPNKNKIRLKKL